MLKKTITFNDLDGNPITEDFYFNLSKAELAEMELSVKGGMKARLESIIESEDGAKIIAAYSDILRRSYGRRSLDNRSFVKSQDAWENFVGTEAYDQLFMELITDAKKSAEFIAAIMPKELAEQAGLVSGKTTTVELPKPPAVPSFSFTENEINTPLTSDQILRMSPEEFVALQKRRMEG